MFTVAQLSQVFGHPVVGQGDAVTDHALAGLAGPAVASEKGQGGKATLGCKCANALFLRDILDALIQGLLGSGHQH